MTQIDSPTILQYLDMLLKHRNYTKAAKELYISQPYLTQTIKRIEKDLGTDIINRATSPLQLTTAGKLYYQYLISLENQQKQFRQQLMQYATPEQKVLRIGILSGLGTYLLPLFLPNFIKDHPDVQVELLEDFPEANEEKTLAGNLDFFIGQNPETISPELKVHSVGAHGYYAVIPESSRFYRSNQNYLPEDSLSIKELLREPLVLTKHGSAIRRQVDYLLQKFNIQPTIVLETSNVFTAANLAKANLGVTFVAESIEGTYNNQAFNLYKLPLELVSLDYFISYANNKTLHDYEQDLVQCFLATLQQSIADADS